MDVNDARPKIKPPLAPNAKEAALIKAEVESELKNKKHCVYKAYECTQLTLDGYNFCLKHILQDKSAPFKQCSYIHSGNGKRCHLAAPRTDKKEFAYCNEHSMKTILAKNRHNARYPPPKTAEAMLYSLRHYLKKPKSSSVCEDNGTLLEDESVTEQRVTKSLDPFVEIDASQVHPSRSILDFCSESDSDVEPSYIASVWPDGQNDSSDNESIDSEDEDPLKHANVYTEEEISRITRDKLVKLQGLYIEQYRYLQHVFKEKKRKYYQTLKREKETCCSIFDQIRENPKEQRLYKKLKALNKYNKTYGAEAILEKRLHDSRTKSMDGPHPKAPSFSRCIYNEGGVRCTERALPLARHCRKHILEDQNQVLFKQCGKKNADVDCITPVEAIFENVCCKLHMDIPPLKSYSQARKNSESDMEDSFEGGEHIPIESIETSQRNEEMQEVPSVLFEESSIESIKTNETLSNPEKVDIVNMHDTTPSNKMEVDANEPSQTTIFEGQQSLEQKTEENSIN